MSDSKNNIDSRPDLNESINVTEAHGALKKEASAAGREKVLRENGMEPVSLGLIAVSAAVVLVAGVVLGQRGQGSYIRAKSPIEEEKVLPPQPALSFLQKQGAKIYNNCASCHQKDGLGQAGAIPPLAGSEWVLGNTEKLAMIIHNGVAGEIKVKGTTYSSVMAAIGANLNEKDLAALMTYLRTSWGNDASIVTPEMAANALAISAARGGGQTSSAELLKNHDKMLEGAELAPDTLLDPDSWQPVPSK